MRSRSTVFHFPCRRPSYVFYGVPGRSLPRGLCVHVVESIPRLSNLRGIDVVQCVPLPAAGGRKWHGVTWRRDGMEARRTRGVTTRRAMSAFAWLECWIGGSRRPGPVEQRHHCVHPLPRVAARRPDAGQRSGAPPAAHQQRPAQHGSIKLQQRPVAADANTVTDASAFCMSSGL